MSADRSDATGLREAVEALLASRLTWGTHTDRWGDVEWQREFWTEAATIALAAHPEPPEADPTAGERGCRSRNPEPPHQRCENVVCDGRHRDYPADPGKPETRGVDAEPDAGDVEALIAELADWERPHAIAEDVMRSDWLAADRAATAERIARAIEAELRAERQSDPSTYNVWSRVTDAVNRAARIDRGEGR